MSWRQGVVVAAIYIVASAATAIAHAIDKRAAGRGKRRISEQTLHLFEFLGGWPGALWAQARLRHKTRKWSFRIVTFMMALLHVGAWSAWAYFEYFAAE